MPSLPPRRSAAALQPVCAAPCCLRPSVADSASGAYTFGATLRSLSLRPGNSPTTPYGGRVNGLQIIAFAPPCHPNYGALALTPAGLSPAERASLCWTHIRTGALTHTAPTFGSDRGPHGDRRIRSAACVTVPRLGVRAVLWPLGFPSVPGLGSSNSAAARYRLVRCLHRYYAGVRLLCALHHRLTASRLPMRSHRLPDRTTRRPPRSQRGAYVRAWGLRRRDVRLCLAIAAHPILPSTMRRASAHSDHIIFVAQYPARTRRYRRFTDTLTGIAARLAVNRGSAHPSFQRKTTCVVPSSFTNRCFTRSDCCGVSELELCVL